MSNDQKANDREERAVICSMLIILLPHANHLRVWSGLSSVLPVI